MTQTTSELAPVQFPRGGGQKAVLWLDMWQLISAGICMVGFLLVLIFGGFLGPWLRGGVAVALLVSVAVIVINVQGRPLPWWMRQRIEHTRRANRGQNDFVAEAASQRELDADEEADQAAIAAGVPAPVRLRLPGEAAELRCYTLSEGAMLLWDPTVKTATMIARVAPHGFRMAEPEDQSDVINNWAALMDSLYSEPGVIAVQASDTITTASAADMRAAYERQVETAAQEGLAAGPELSPLLHSDYLDLLSGDRAQVQHDNLAAITLSQPAIREQVKASGGGIDGLLTVCARQQQLFEDLLREASVEVVKWLDVDDMAQVVRRAFVPDEAVAINEGRSSVTPATSGPMAVSVEWDRLRCDGAWHRVMEISQWPTREQKPGFMRHLNGVDFPHVVTHVLHPRGVNAGMKKVQDRSNDQRSAAILRDAMGRTEQLSDAAVDSDLQRTGAELLAGHGMVDFVGLIVVSGATADELETNTQRMISGATRAGCELRKLYGQQWAGFLSTALPLGRGLIKAK